MRFQTFKSSIPQGCSDTAKRPSAEGPRAERGCCRSPSLSEIGVKNGLAQVTANISSERLTDDLRRQEPVKRSGWPRHQVHAASVRARSRTV